MRNQTQLPQITLKYFTFFKTYLVMPFPRSKQKHKTSKVFMFHENMAKRTSLIHISLYKKTCVAAENTVI